MAAYKSTIFALILAAVCSLTFAYCPEDLDPDVCAEQYRRFEKAMLENKNNFYKLHTEFFPPGYASPVYGWVIYDIYVPCKPEPESGSGNGTLLEPTDHYCRYLIYKYWSSSPLLAHINPLILNSFQLYALDLTFASVEFALKDKEHGYSLFKPSQVNVRLKMIIDNDTDWDLNNTSTILDDITSWVSYLCFTLYISGRTIVKWGYTSFKTIVGGGGGYTSV